MNLEGFYAAFSQKTPWGRGTDARELGVRLFSYLDWNADGSIEVCVCRLWERKTHVAAVVSTARSFASVQMRTRMRGVRSNVDTTRRCMYSVLGLRGGHRHHLLRHAQ